MPERKRSTVTIWARVTKLPGRKLPSSKPAKTPAADTALTASLYHLFSGTSLKRGSAAG